MLERLGCHVLGDERVLIVDPAAGSGAYPLAVAATPALRPGTVTLASGCTCSSRCPARPAFLARAAGPGRVDERDALHGGRRPVEAPIVVCLGNPPYRRRARHALRSRPHWLMLSRGGRRCTPRTSTTIMSTSGAGRCARSSSSAPGRASSASSRPRRICVGRALPACAGCCAACSTSCGSSTSKATTSPRGARDNVFPIRTPVAIAHGRAVCRPAPGRPAMVHYTRADRRPRRQAGRARRHAPSSTDLAWRLRQCWPDCPLIPRAPRRLRGLAEADRAVSVADLGRPAQAHLAHRADTGGAARALGSSCSSRRRTERATAFRRDPRSRPRLDASRPAATRPCGSSHSAALASGARVPRARAVRVPQLRPPVGASRRAAGRLHAAQRCGAWPGRARSF